MFLQEINETGPKCAWCGVRPDDPVWCQPASGSKDLACFGCVADLRAGGDNPRVLGRAIFVRESSNGLRISSLRRVDLAKL